jgi:NMD protein affecting ribosome stability and mRNA decay
MNDRSLTCPRCGTANAPAARFCQGCGAGLNPNLPVPVPIRVPVKLDEAVSAACGWLAGLADEGVLARLLALNGERAG